MGQKIGRNDTCPCGSGKKYKKCCGTSNADPSILDLAWRTLRNTEGHIVDQHLMPYVMKTFPPAIIKTAIEEFLPEDLPEEIDEEHLFNQFVFPWILFGWIAEEEVGVPGFDSMQSIAMNYLNSFGSKLNSVEKAFIRAISTTHYSFFSVLEVELEKSVIVKDIFLGTEHRVKERQGTHVLKRGDVIFSRILTLDEQSIFVGMAPFIIPITYQTSLLDFKDWLIEENDNNPLTSEALRTELDIDIFDYFFETLVYLHSNPRPTVVNTDGDLILFSTKPYDIPEVEEQLKLMAKKHWETWFDSPIPALNDETPREAAKTKAGRERLEALLLLYERNDREMNDATHYFKADINYIKTELELK